MEDLLRREDWHAVVGHVDVDLVRRIDGVEEDLVDAVGGLAADELEREPVQGHPRPVVGLLRVEVHTEAQVIVHVRVAARVLDRDLHEG